jgi:hypothetical protein
MFYFFFLGFAGCLHQRILGQIDRLFIAIALDANDSTFGLFLELDILSSTLLKSGNFILPELIKRKYFEEQTPCIKSGQLIGI